MYIHVRRQTYRLFAPEQGGRIGYLLDWFIMILIMANVAAVMLETVDSLAASYGAFFHYFELVSVVIFTIEYLARVWSAVDGTDYEGPITGRLRYASRPLLIVDLLAILPFYLAAAGFAVDLRFLRALRLIRILRLLKLARYSQSLQAFSAVLRRKKPDLVIAVFANAVLLVVASSAMYYVEHTAQPEAFSSIPQTLWWGVATLTTVGYGDVHPITPVGQFFGALTAVFGIGLFALPASILASGFIEVAGADEAEGCNCPTYCPACGEHLKE